MMDIVPRSTPLGDIQIQVYADTHWRIPVEVQIERSCWSLFPKHPLPGTIVVGR